MRLTDRTQPLIVRLFSDSPCKNKAEHKESYSSYLLFSVFSLFFCRNSVRVEASEPFVMEIMVIRWNGSLVETAGITMAC